MHARHASRRAAALAPARISSQQQAATSAAELEPAPCGNCAHAVPPASHHLTTLVHAPALPGRSLSVPARAAGTRCCGCECARLGRPWRLGHKGRTRAHPTSMHTRWGRLAAVGRRCAKRAAAAAQQTTQQSNGRMPTSGTTQLVRVIRVQQMAVFEQIKARLYVPSLDALCAAAMHG